MGWIAWIGDGLKALALALGLLKTNQDQKAGVALQTAADASASNRVLTAEAQAEVDAPKTDSAVEARLRDGTF